MVREKPQVCALILGAVLVAIFLLAIVIAFSVRSSSGGSATETVKPNCKEDGFDPITYTVKNSGKEVKKRIKIKFVEDTANDEYYNFEAATAECKKINASLWEIADGQPEWEAVIKMANDTDRSSMWLNANTANSHCPGMRFSGQPMKEIGSCAACLSSLHCNISLSFCSFLYN